MSEMQSRPQVAQLVTEHHEAVYRYAYRLTGSVQDAEDLTQQMFLLAQRNIGQLRNINNSRPWLFAILRNCFLKDRVRRRPIVAADLPLNMDLLPTPPAKEGVDQDQLQDALNQLPEAFRLVLLMFYFEECSYREIAERLEIPIGTVMSRLARAKDYLRSILFKPEPGMQKSTNQSAPQRG
jgi:RNA polymerase sigma-70 factor, ECF subfamily